MWAEDARLRVARLRARRDRSDLREAHAEPQHRGEGVGILVEPGGKTDRIRKVEPEDTAGENGIVRLALRRAEAGTERPDRSEEHTSELQSLMRPSYAVFCW